MLIGGSGCTRQERKVWKLSCVHNTLCGRVILFTFFFSIIIIYFFKWPHTRTHKIQLSTLYSKVSFGQPARQESVNKIVTIHWKIITCQEKVCSGYIFPAASWNCKSAALHAHTERCWSKAARGLFYTRLWMLMIGLSLDIWSNTQPSLRGRVI